MKERTRKSNIDGLPVLLLFAVFMVLILLVLLTGADVVQKLSARDQASYDGRTAVQYITTKVRQADRTGGVSVCDFAGCDALVFAEEYDGVRYETLIYCYDGAIRELFAEAGTEQEPAYGEPVLTAQELEIRDQGPNLQVELRLAAGRTETMLLHIRSGEGAAL